MILAIDFDGTLCVNRYPEIGEPNEEMITALKTFKSYGDELILWTCRKDERLKEAVEWCKERGLIFDAINENLPRIIEEFGGDTRKVFADYYIDDSNMYSNLSNKTYLYFKKER